MVTNYDAISNFTIFIVIVCLLICDKMINLIFFFETWKIFLCRSESVFKPRVIHEPIVRSDEIKKIPSYRQQILNKNSMINKLSLSILSETSIVNKLAVSNSDPRREIRILEQKLSNMTNNANVLPINVRTFKKLPTYCMKLPIMHLLRVHRCTKYRMNSMLCWNKLSLFQLEQNASFLSWA